MNNSTNSIIDYRMIRITSNNNYIDYPCNYAVTKSLNDFNLALNLQQKYNFDLADLLCKYSTVVIDIFLIENFDNLDMTDSNVLYLIGYYHKFKKNYILAKKYLKLSVELDQDNIFALNELGKFYRDIEKNPCLMMKNFMKAIKLNSSNAMLNLSIYYRKNNNLAQMKRFLLLSVKFNNSTAMFNLAKYYLEISNTEKALEYFNMAIELQNKFAMCELGNYYYEINNIDVAIQYYTKAIELNDVTSMYNLGLHYQTIGEIEPMEKYYTMCLKFIENIGLSQYDNILSNLYNNIGCYYKEIENYEQAENYFISSAKLNNLEAILNLHDLFEQTNPELAKKYLYQSIDLNCEIGLNILEEKINSQSEFYLELLNIKKNSPILIECVENRIGIFENLNNYTQTNLA